MLIQMLIDQPRMLGPILTRTPPWVWGLLAAVVLLGLSQARARSVSLARVGVLPAAMTALSVWGTASAFGSSPQFISVLFAWFAAMALAVAVAALMAPAAGARYDLASRSFVLPGSWVPLLLILGIFLTKYVVGVELAMRPGLALDADYARVTGALYGLFSGTFIGRAARLWRLALRGGPEIAHPVNA